MYRSTSVGVSGHPNDRILLGIVSTPWHSSQEGEAFPIPMHLIQCLVDGMTQPLKFPFLGKIRRRPGRFR
jgi:hypothetical protein